MSKQSAVDLVLAFVERLNNHDVAGMTELMDPDHLFVDSLGASVRGRETLRPGWTSYFQQGLCLSLWRLFGLLLSPFGPFLVE